MINLFNKMSQDFQKTLDKFNKDMEKNFKFLKQDLSGKMASSEEKADLIIKIVENNTDDFFTPTLTSDIPYQVFKSV